MTAKSRWEKFIILTQSPQNVTPIFFTRSLQDGYLVCWQLTKGTSHVNYWKEVFVEVSSKQEWDLWRYVTVDVSWIHHESVVSTVGFFHNIFHPMKKLLRKLKDILQNSTNLKFWVAYNSWNIAGTSVFTLEDIMF